VICATCLANAEKISPGKSKSAYDFWRASEGNAELQRLKTRLRNEDRMKAVLEPIFKKRREVTSPANGLPLPSTNLISLEALRKAIETYLSCRPELKSELLSKAFFGGERFLVQRCWLARMAKEFPQNAEPAEKEG